MNLKHRILESIRDMDFQQSYLQHKIDQYENDYRISEYATLLMDPDCQATIQEISNGIHKFSIPKKKMISRYNVGKKRIVYSFEPDEMMALRLITEALYSYDYLFSSSLYSFRKGHGIRNAIQRIKRTPKIHNMWGLKADIHNYFNSIPTERILHELSESLPDHHLNDLFRQILSDKRIQYNGAVFEENKGVMAGIPISAFLANFYLRDMDEYFTSNGVFYMRYADDILFFGNTEEELLSLKNDLVQIVQSKGLEMNPKKELLIRPGDKFDFLGFSISSTGIGISESMIRKTKGKISRSARRLRRWMIKKGAPIDGTLRAWFRDWNEMFYGHIESEVTWCRWYFPVIDKVDGLHEIDKHIQMWARYIPNGRHCKKNYSILRYDALKRCGYRPLVHEYYEFLKEKSKIEQE